MGVLFGYFAAADDDDAARAVLREDGEPTATGYDGFDVNAMDPTADLLPAEALITGRSEDGVRADPRHGHLIAMTEDGDLVCLSLTDALRNALATTDRASLQAVAEEWATSPTFPTPPNPTSLAEFLHRTADLATRATSRGHHLYCWICV
ncbi:hypothetical protein ABZT03_12610 [Streptomyces sp. NPDC005574]|uniref:hypothetical protein n=1 Tax=Streptomyces sp. NPDC005574 TaxID=3156891 RepID=UPI0033B1697F